TVAQAARQAGVNPRTIRRWCDEGKLPCVRVPVGERNPPPGRSFPPGTTPYERRIDPDDLAQVVAGTATTATRWDSRTVIRLIRDLDHALAETGGFLDDDHL